MDALIGVIKSEVGDIASLFPVHGGDINQSYQIQNSRDQKFFLKVNRRECEPMFEAEIHGLRVLSENSNFRIPRVMGVYTGGDNSGLLMEWIEKSQPDERSWEQFWRCLSDLHSIQGESFGLAENNFIGVIDQDNTPDPNWIEFWIERRVSPLMALAIEKGQLKDKDIPAILALFDAIRRNFGQHQFTPRLLHGDLWHGNLIFDENGYPTLVDPSVYYGWPEMELAFMDFFGGFAKHGYENYTPDCAREFLGDNYYPVWQVYPLLVHTVIFGGTYSRRLMNTVKISLDLF